jgi:signal transduction histidine kinase
VTAAGISQPPPAPAMPGRGDVRLRLTVLYAALFLGCGAALLGITYALVSHATPGVFGEKTGVIITATGTGTGTATGADKGTAAGTGAGTADPVTTGPGAGSGLPASGGGLREQVRAYAAATGAAENDTLLAYSGVALAIMTVASAWLGWFAAGRALRPLEAAYEAQRQFVANASHELRTPLARARTLLEVALRTPDAAADTLRAACERALAAGAEQERLIAALLTLARGQHGMLRQDPLDIGALAREALAARGETMAARGLSVAGRLESAPVRGDFVLTERMIANLLDNAVCHNVAGGTVWVTSGVEAGRAVLEVANTGPAIPPWDVARLQQPFQRRAAARVRPRRGPAGADGGLGLGLPVVRAIAEAHGGTLALSARDGGGLTARLTFPAAVPARLIRQG